MPGELLLQIPHELIICSFFIVCFFFFFLTSSPPIPKTVIPTLPISAHFHSFPLRQLYFPPHYMDTGFKCFITYCHRSPRVKKRQRQAAPSYVYAQHPAGQALGKAVKHRTSAHSPTAPAACSYRTCPSHPMTQNKTGRYFSCESRSEQHFILFLRGR